MSAEKQVVSETWRENIFGDVIILMLPLGKFSTSVGIIIKKEDSVLAISNGIVLHFIPSLFQI